jgi:hypothetical protein
LIKSIEEKIAQKELLADWKLSFDLLWLKKMAFVIGRYTSLS